MRDTTRLVPINFALSLLPFERIESVEMGLKVKALIEGDSK
jgi:hypothetical protein